MGHNASSSGKVKGGREHSCPQRLFNFGPTLSAGLCRRPCRNHTMKHFGGMDYFHRVLITTFCQNRVF